MHVRMWNQIKYIEHYYLPIFWCLSLLGNSLSVYVLFCTKLRYNSSSIYLRALAMSDIGALTTVAVMWSQQIQITNLDYIEYAFHVPLIGLQMSFGFLSVWIVVAFTVQRYIVIKWPLLRRSLCTVNRAKNVVIGLAGLAVLYSIPWFVMCSLIMYTTDADDQMRNILFWCRIFVITNTIITLVLPATMIAIFNTLIVYNIRKQNRIRGNLILSSFASNKKTQSSDNKASNTEVTKMLVIISSLFICLNTPFQVGLLFSFFPICSRYCDLILLIGRLLWLANYGMDFVLYCATGKNFRSKLIRMFTKSSDIRRNENMERENFEDYCDYC